MKRLEVAKKLLGGSTVELGLLVMPRTSETNPWPVEEAVSVTVCLSRHILFLRFHTAQMTIEKRVGS